MILFLSVAMLLAGCDKDNAPVAVSEVTLSRTALTMTVGDTEKLTATVLPEHALDLRKKKLLHCAKNIRWTEKK